MGRWVDEQEAQKGMNMPSRKYLGCTRKRDYSSVHEFVHAGARWAIQDRQSNRADLSSIELPYDNVLDEHNSSVGRHRDSKTRAKRLHRYMIDDSGIFGGPPPSHGHPDFLRCHMIHRAGYRIPTFTVGVHHSQ